MSMINLMRTFVLLSTILIIGSASGASGKSFDSAIGEWSWRFEGPNVVETGQMTIVDETKATYPYRNGRILFYAIDDQRKWEGYWVESWESYYDCADKKDGSGSWGTVIFQFNDTYTKWKGEWDYCGGSYKYTWDGFR